MTDGMLMQQLLSDPLLNRYDAVIIDDCHDRSVDADLVLGLLKMIRRQRKDLKIVITSATLDTQLLVDYFAPDKVGVVYVMGRMYPVELCYLQNPTRDYLQ